MGLPTAPRWAWVTIVVGLIVLVVLTPIAVRRGAVPATGLAQSQGGPRATAASPAAAARVDIAALGGSFTAGSAMDSGQQSEWPALLTAQQPWTVTPFAVSGAGFVHEDVPGTAIGSQVDRVIAAAPDVVVVAGGHDDARESPAAVQAAARDVLTRLHTGLPDAKLVVIGVLWPGQPAGFVTTINNRLRDLAGEVGATFVDALSEGWLNGSDPPLIGIDGVHPTDEGQAALAEHIGNALLAAGVPGGT